MSLHQLADHVQSAGRGEDKVLVHMTPKEVSGLQALAMAHGGSLTINPETGLPEAGFLSSILPMVAGLALAPLTAGTSLAFLGSPMAAAALVGGGTALATGDLKKGLMAGLGAYGGAGLGAGLAQVGTAGAAKAAGTSAVEMAKTAGPTGAGPIFSQATSGGVTLPSQSTAANTAVMPSTFDKMAAGVKTLGESGGVSNLYSALPTGTLPAAGGAIAMGMADQGRGAPKDISMIRPYTYERTQNPEAYDMGEPIYSATPGSSAERTYFTDKYTALTPYEAPGPEYRKAAEGGLMGMAVGGPVEMMSAMNAIGGNTMYPQSQLQTPLYSNPAVQRPEAVNVISPSAEPAVGMYSGEPKFADGGEINLHGTVNLSKDVNAGQLGNSNNYQPSRDGMMGNQTQGQLNPYQNATVQNMSALTQLGSGLGRAFSFAGGGISDLGGYSDGGRLLKGPGDGVSDSIPAVIGKRQPARLADGEFVIPARIVSELGNGSTEAGARKLYAMMERVQNTRKKSIGKKKVAVNSKADKHLPA